MAISETYSNAGATIGATEYSLTAASTTLGAITTDGVYQLFLDMNAMVAADQYQIRIYEKCYSSGTQRVVYEAILTGAQNQPIFSAPSLILIHGWEMTVKKLAGTDRSIPWSIRQVA